MGAPEKVYILHLQLLELTIKFGTQLVFGEKLVKTTIDTNWEGLRRTPEIFGP